MMLKEEKNAVMQEYATHEGDTGSPEVQIAVLTKRINDLNEHLKLECCDAFLLLERFSYPLPSELILSIELP